MLCLVICTVVGDEGVGGDVEDNDVQSEALKTPHPSLLTTVGAVLASSPTQEMDLFRRYLFMLMFLDRPALSL